MAEKQLKVTNIATGKTWMKTADEIKAMKSNPTLASRFKFEKEVDAPAMAPKIDAPKPAPAPMPQQPQTPPAQPQANQENKA
jgi:hypothetical protein